MAVFICVKYPLLAKLGIEPWSPEDQPVILTLLYKDNVPLEKACKIYKRIKNLIPNSVSETYQKLF